MTIRPFLVIILCLCVVTAGALKPQPTIHQAPRETAQSGAADLLLQQDSFPPVPAEPEMPAEPPADDGQHPVSGASPAGPGAVSPEQDKGHDGTENHSSGVSSKAETPSETPPSPANDSSRPAPSSAKQPAASFAKPLYSLDNGIALTFDDGPSKYTGQLLDILKKYNVQATFFFIGENVKSREDMVRRTAAEGHAIGNHTFRHAHLKKLSKEEQENEIEAGKKAIERAADIAVTLFRPPYGNLNNDTRQIAGERGDRIILWSVDPRDWDTRDPEKVAQHVLSSVKDGDIVLLHERSSTVEALPAIIEGIQKMGYAFKKIPEK